MQNIIEELGTKIPKKDIKQNHRLACYTTFKIGGEAEVFVTPSHINEVEWAVNIAKKHGVPYYVLGNGSNILIDDNGLRGIIIYLGKKFKKIETNKNRITGQSGASLEEISKAALQHSLAGLEFAVGIPGP